MLQFVKREEESPVCPHCKKEIKVVYFREMRGDLGKRCLYFCPACKAALGVSQRKGLTFGW